jgi:hypothetical protein
METWRRLSDCLAVVGNLAAVHQDSIRSGLSGFTAARCPEELFVRSQAWRDVTSLVATKTTLFAKKQ